MSATGAIDAKDEPRRPTLSGDAAKRVISEDLFGLEEIAKAVAEVVRSRLSAGGYAIGIEGSWGSGKTTLLNFVADILDSEPSAHHKVIRFEPWLIGSKESLLRTFFKELLDKIKELQSDPDLRQKPTQLGKELLDRLLRRIEQYAGFLEFGESTAAAVAAFDPTGQTLLASLILKVLSAISKLIKRPTPTIEALKKNIIDDLGTLNEILPEIRITVLIDDTDRLDPEDSVEVLRLIKAVANFPTITYLVCFDRIILTSQVLQILKVGTGEDYIEKIFQQIIPLPPQEPFALRRFVQAQLAEHFGEEMASAQSADLEFDARQDALFDTWIGRLIETPRDAIRLCEAVKFGWPYLRDRGDFFDYVWLQLIKLKAPRLYTWVQRYVVNLGSYRDGGRPGDDAPITEATELRSIMKDLKWTSLRGRTRITYFLPGLDSFGLEDERGKVYDLSSPDDLSTLESNKRLGSPFHWRFNFAFGKPSYAFDDSQLAEFLSLAAKDWKIAAEYLRNLASKVDRTPGHNLNRFLDQLGPRSAQGSAEQQIGMAEAFADVMDVLPPALGADFSDSNSWRKAAKLLTNSVGPHFARIASERASICWLSFVVREQAFALGVLDQGRSFPDRQWLTREEFDRALGNILQRFHSMDLINIFEAAVPIHILYCWEMYGDSEKLKASIDLAASDDAIFIKALRAMTIPVMSSAKGLYASLEERVVASFMDGKAAKERLGRISNNEDVSVDLKRSAGELLAAWADNIPQ